MTLKEHKMREDDNESLIFLYKEGVLWKAYEKSAYLLSLRGYDYQVNWRSSEDCPEGVVSVGTSLPPEAIAGISNGGRRRSRKRCRGPLRGKACLPVKGKEGRSRCRPVP